MKIKHIENYICLFVLLFCGCANIVPPNGGEKDVSAPRLVSASPENKSVLFNSNRIILKFDEYILLKNSNLIQISPSCGEKAIISQRGKQIEMNLNCSLEKNTTYSINFGNSIIDLNEGNELKNFKYIFSTGSKLDSLIIKGKVHRLYNDDVDDGPVSMVALYKDTISEAPYYYTFSKPNGEFIIENIKQDSYMLYAVLDENGNLDYDGGELNSFPTLIDTFDTIVNLGLFYNNINAKIKDVINICGNAIEFQHNIIQDSIYILNTNGWWNVGEESSVFWFHQSPRAIKYEFNGVIDSVEIYNTDSTKINLKISRNINEIHKTNTISIKSNRPIKSVEKNMFKWQNRDVETAPLIKDPFTVSLPIDFNFENNKEKLILNSGAIMDVFGAKSDSIGFEIDFNPSRYGKLMIRNNSPINIEDNYIVELFQKNEILHKNEITDSLMIPFITPGTYHIRVFNDINNDFFWTTGNVDEKQKPEPIYTYPEAIEIKSNWEIDVEIML